MEKLRDKAAEPVLERVRADRDRADGLLRVVLTVIETRLFDHDFDVSALWREAGTNRDTSPRFTGEMDATPWAYLTERRIEVGATLLATTRLKVWQIGNLLGYAGNTFTRAFSRTREIGPTKYRRQACRKPRSDPFGRVAVDGARHGVARFNTALQDQKVTELGLSLGLTCHERACERRSEGDVDGAYQDLWLARRCYGAASEISAEVRERIREIPLAAETDAALLSALCPDCRGRLDGDAGRGLRTKLRRALDLVPRDLRWFEVCCDDCYRVVWDAVSRARLGLVDDAYQAWWLSENADLNDHRRPPSRGRIIAALAEAERRVFGDQLERKGYCDLALRDAVALEDPLLEAEARIWTGSVLRAMGKLMDARAELAKAAEASRRAPWLHALHTRMLGLLEENTNDRREALVLFRSAAEMYEGLDPHVAALLLIQQANSHFYLAEYEESVKLDQRALSSLDNRRDQLPGTAAVPIHLAHSFSLLGRWEEADAALSQFLCDREAHIGLAAAEVFTRGCMELLRGRPQESLGFLAEAKELFAGLHRPLDIALVASYSIEAHARLGNRNAAIENLTAALKFFQAARCPQDTMEALGKLRAILEPQVVDATAVTASIRNLTRRHGGWLPEPSPVKQT